MSYDDLHTPVTDKQDVQPRRRLLEQVRARLRIKHYSLQTEQAYLGWTRRSIREHGMHPPPQLDGAQVQTFLTRLATCDHVAASTQNQPLSAVLTLYRE